MKKNNKILIVLVVLALLAVGGLSVYAYQKEQSYKNNVQVVPAKTSSEKVEEDLKSEKTKFDNEKEVDKKISVLEETLNKKNRVDKEGKDNLTQLFNDTTNKMKEDIKKLVEDKIKEYTLNAQEEQSAQKVDDTDKNLDDLRKLLDEKKALIYSDEEITTLLAQIDALREANRAILTQQEAQRQLTDQNQQAGQQATEQPAAVQPVVPAQPTQPVQPRNQGVANNTVVQPTTPSNNAVVQPTQPNNGTNGTTTNTTDGQ